MVLYVFKNTLISLNMSEAYEEVDETEEMAVIPKKQETTLIKGTLSQQGMLKATKPGK